jgi:hypothetical protein
MNYLELCKRTHEMAGLSGTGPASVVSQAGISARVVNWVAQAWDEIQTVRTDWKWRRKSETIAVTTGLGTYALETLFPDYEDIVRGSVRVYGAGETIADRTKLEFILWQEWIDQYENITVPGRPTVYTIDPANNLIIGPGVPEKDYTLLFDYVKQVTQLAANGDTPDMPVQFHMAIVYLALRYYAAYDDATQVYQDADAQYRRAIARMASTQAMPMVISAEPLA